MVKIIGHMELPVKNRRASVLRCDDCGSAMHCIGHKIESLDKNDNVIGVRYVCDYCLDELFGDHEPTSIFEHTSDWERM